MKKYILLLLIFSLGKVYSQVSIENIVVTDIDGQEFNLESNLELGRFVIVHFFTTWSEVSADYYRTGILNKIDSIFGENALDTIRILHYEVDENTSNEDINGIGGNTVLNWNDGNSQIIVNPSEVNLDLESLVPNGVSRSLLIGPNRQVLYDLTNINDFEALLLILNSFKISSSPEPFIRENELRIFPNPANDRIEIEYIQPISKVYIYNSSGRLIDELVNISGNTIKISHLKPGYYFLLLEAEGNRCFNRKFLKI